MARSINRIVLTVLRHRARVAMTLTLSLLSVPMIALAESHAQQPSAKRITTDLASPLEMLGVERPRVRDVVLPASEAFWLTLETVECANDKGGNEAFWQYADLLYERTSSNGNGLYPDALVPLAQEIGLDEETFKACLESGRMTARVKEDVVEGGKIGISGTTGNIIINNETGDAVPAAGALPTEKLQNIVNRLMLC